MVKLENIDNTAGKAPTASFKVGDIIETVWNSSEERKRSDGTSYYMAQFKGNGYEFKALITGALLKSMLIFEKDEGDEIMLIVAHKQKFSTFVCIG